MLPYRILVSVLVLTLVDRALATPYSLYTFSIKSTSTNIRTCDHAMFTYSISPTLSTHQPVYLLVSAVPTVGDSFKVLDGNAHLDRGAWLWNTVDVPAGQYVISMVSRDIEKYEIRGLSDPFIVRLANTNCLGSAYSSVPPQSSETSSSSLTPSSSPTPSSSSSPSMPGLPTNISKSIRPSVGLRIGVSMTAIVVIFAGGGALYGLIIDRRHWSYRRSITFGGLGPGYDGL